MTKEQAIQLQEHILLEAAALVQDRGAHADTSLSERAVNEVGEAWDLDPKETLTRLYRLKQEMDAARESKPGEPAESHFTKEEIAKLPTGARALEIVWGLFETAVRLETRQQRGLMFEIANYLADALGLEEGFDPAEAARSA